MIVVTGESAGAVRPTIQTSVAPILERPLGERLDVVIVPEAALGTRTMEGYRLDGSSAVLHELDIVQLRQHAIVLSGPDIRDQLPLFSAADVIGDIVTHVIHEMLPPVVRACPTDDWDFLQDVLMPYTFVMVRCLCTLRTGDVSTKRGAVDWLRLYVDTHSQLATLTDLSETFGRWYGDGLPAEPAVERLTVRFPDAAREFVREVSTHESVALHPDDITADSPP